MPTITCARCGRERSQLARAPLSGQLGQTVLARVCEPCWRDWKDESVRIINHLGLQPADPAQRAQLYGHLREYLKIPDV